MKSSRLFLTVSSLILVLFLGCGSTANARVKLVFTPDGPDDTRKLVHAVNPAAATVEIETMVDGVMHPYKIDLGTVIKVNGSTGTFSDIKVGMEVIDYTERDPQTLDSISVGPAGPAPTAPPAKNKKTPPPQ